ncbi:MAG: hypothetical protein ACE5RC_02355 [Nitrosopumilus sp.]
MAARKTKKNTTRKSARSTSSINDELTKLFKLKPGVQLTKNGRHVGRRHPAPARATDIHFVKLEGRWYFWWTRNGLGIGGIKRAPLGTNDAHIRFP